MMRLKSDLLDLIDAALGGTLALLAGTAFAAATPARAGCA